MRNSKIMTVSEAVERFIFDGASIGVGGMNVVDSPTESELSLLRGIDPEGIYFQE